MNTRLLALAGGAGAVLLFLLLSALFTVHQTQQALVLQFGNPVRIIQDPGLHFKIPFIQQVEYYEKRVLDFDAPSVELVLGDQKRLVVDAFARYRINDALRFRQSVGNETAFRGRLEPIVFSSLRSVLGEVPLFTILSQDRNQLMDRIKSEVNKALVGFRRRTGRRADQAGRPAAGEQPGRVPAHADRARARGEGVAGAGCRGRAAHPRTGRS